MSTYTIDTATSRATPTPAPGKRLTAPALLARKGGEPIVGLTAYTMRMAQLLDPHCDLLLVGDSLGQVIYGLPSTIPVSLEMMCAHGAAVVRGSWHALVAVDMPFGSYEESPAQAFRNAARVLKATGAAAVKLEGGGGRGGGGAGRLPRPPRHSGDRPCRPDAAGGQRAGRLPGEGPRRCRGGQGAGRRPRRRRSRLLRARARRGDGGDRRGSDPGGRLSDHRHRRFGALRRPDPRHRGHARPVRADAALRQEVRRSGRRNRSGRSRLCRGRE